MEWGFLIKKVISFFLEPFGVVALLLFLVLYFLYRNRLTKAKVLFTLGFFLLLLFSYPPFANFLVQGLEDEYSKYDYSQEIRFIHVLGNGHTTDATQPISSQLSSAGVKRVLEGVIIYKQSAGSKIVFTGYEGMSDTSNAQMNANLALILGVDAEDIIINGVPKDTQEEAEFLQSIVGSEPFVLVTSASHMPRAMMLFESLGMHPIAAPTNFYKSEFLGYLRVPEALYFHISTVAIHEYLGLLWTKLKG